jgi:hypothetical protein
MDAKDCDSLTQMATDDLRGVDEITRQWTHGRKAIIDGLRQSPIDGLHTDVRDIKETTWGDVGLVTCWIEQDYTYPRQATAHLGPDDAVVPQNGIGLEIGALPLGAAARSKLVRGRCRLGNPERSVPRDRGEVRVVVQE